MQLISQADGDKVITAVWSLSLGLEEEGSNKRVTFAKMSNTDWNITENIHSGKETGESSSHSLRRYHNHLGPVAPGVLR